MFRFVSIILLNYILFLQIRLGFSEYNDKSTVCDCKCNCVVQLEVVNDDLEDLRNSKCSNKQLLANRASKPSSCTEAAFGSKSGIYKIKVEKLNITDLAVFCEEDVDSGGWLVIQRRQSSSVNFTRNWHDYKEGFGDLTGNYWIGLEKLYALTSNFEHELYIQMRRRNGQAYYAKYSQILIGNESEDYILKKLSDYSGNAGDSLSRHLGIKFSTYDRDNDIDDERNCALDFKGGWWFYGCYASHLNGLYGDDRAGVNWRTIEENECLSFSQMMIRPTQSFWRQLMLS
ncbi:ficolin-1 [Zeugodacus cucurbitae]|uniref:ficolin-1 n=1 Tax=Zeugodacus cucurbitae TaxID=28588 RepID=UPI0023D8FBCA|nr:ficolin-1 [Zeugodacus cucurbitae]